MPKENWVGKEDRAAAAKKHYEEMKEKYKAETERAVQKSIIVDQLNAKKCVFQKKFSSPQIDVTEKDTVTAAFGMNDTAAILNFASYKNPGGAFLKGAIAQEEALCHESNLYNVLEMLEEKFYLPNRKRLNKALYHDNLVYTPEVLFFHKGERRFFHVITCAAPNKSAAHRYQGVSDEEVYQVMQGRIRAILNTAAEQNCENLILGAFGCGVFGNNPYEVAEIFKTYLDTEFQGVFGRAEFAIPGGKNLKAFQEMFSR